MKRETKAESLKIKEIANKYGISEMDVRKIIHSQFSFIRDTCRKLVIDDGMTKEEFDALKSNFTIPSIGKMYASHFLYERIQENKKKSKN